MNDALLTITDLRAGYGERAIVDGVALQVAGGEIVAIIGHNGAGKSTLLRAVFNLVPWRTGVARLGDTDLLPLSPERLLGAGVAYVPQGRSIFPKLTIAENLRMGGYSIRDAATLRERIEAVEARFPRLAERSGQLAGTLSGGEQRMLEIARALLVRPRLVMLDEPSIGLAPKIVEEVFAIVRGLATSGVAVLMVEQNVKQALATADRACVMELGKIRLEDRAAALIGDPRVTRLYLGGGR